MRMGVYYPNLGDDGSETGRPTDRQIDRRTDRSTGRPTKYLLQSVPSKQLDPKLLIRLSAVSRRNAMRIDLFFRNL